jgi:dihydroorotate dehydrogenase (fumarate)
MSVNLSTRYLGLSLKNPLVVAACPLNESLDNLKRAEQAGAAAVVLPSLFEEQITHEEVEFTKAMEYTGDRYAESLTFFPEQEDFRVGPDRYLELISQAKKAIGVPVIASLNGVSKGGWLRYARRMQEGGADALELNIYLIAADMSLTGQQIEEQYLELVSAVKESISIPLAVKIGPFFSSPGHMARRLVEAGADGLVLFNRFLQPDIDLDYLDISPKLVLSTNYELLLPLRWIAILRGRIHASLALTSGIHGPDDMIKALLAGADAGMVASTLYKNGFEQIAVILDGLRQWMEDKEYESVEQLKGSMSQENCPHPAAFERGNYMKALTSFTGNVL